MSKLKLYRLNIHFTLASVAHNTKEARKFFTQDDMVRPEFEEGEYSYIDIVNAISLDRSFTDQKELKKLGTGIVGLEVGVWTGVYNNISVEEYEHTCDICKKRKCTAFYSKDKKLICWDCKNQLRNRRNDHGGSM